METGPKRRLLLSGTSLLLLAFAAAISWWVLAWQTVGWAGLMVLPAEQTESETNSPPGEFAALSEGWPFFGIGPGLVVIVYRGGAAEKVGIQPWDTVLEIDNVSIQHAHQLEKLAARLRVGNTVIYHVRRGKKELSLPLRLEAPSKANQFLIRLCTLPAIALISLAVGLFVYWKKPQDRRAHVFYLLSAVAAALLVFKAVLLPVGDVLGFPSFFTVGEGTVLAMGGVAGLLFWPLLLHLALVFPKERPLVRNHRHILKWIYGAVPGLLLGLTLSAVGPNALLSLFTNGGLTYSLVVILVGFLFLSILLLWRCLQNVGSTGWKRGLAAHPFTTMLGFSLNLSLLVASLAMVVQMLHLPKLLIDLCSLTVTGLLMLGLFFLILLYPITACVALFRSYRESTVEEKRQVRWPLWGILVTVCVSIAVSILGLALIPILGGSRALSLFSTVGDLSKSVLLLLIPMSFAFAILKYRLMDIDLIIKKTVLYTLLSGIILICYLGLAGGMGGLLVKFAGVTNNSVAIFSALTIAAIFVPVRSRVQGFVDRRFFRKKYDYPEALRILSHEILAAGDLQALLQLVAEHLWRALRNRSVVVFTKPPRDQSYWATAKVGAPDEILARLKFDPDSPLLTMTDRIFEVREKDLPEAERMKLRKAGSTLIVPVKLRRELMGFISLGAKLSDQEYDADDIGFLAAVADPVAVGIDNLRLRQREEEFEQAREIQQGLLPRAIPQIGGYDVSGAWQPARVVAGDYFDVFTVSEGKVALCIADVMGKGMPAALLMSNLQATVKAFASDATPPRELCSKINRVISTNTGGGRFITFFYALIDAEGRKLVYANAGHNAPVLLRQDGTVIRLEEGGAVLGIFPDRTYEQGELQLLSGDKLLLFTDGVTEVRNAMQEEFGEERLIAFVAQNREFSADEVQRRLLEAVTKFSGGDFQDDATLVVVSVE